MNAHDPRQYPHRLVFLATQNADARWAVVLVEDEEGEADLGTIAELQDKIEAESNLVIAARTAKGLHAAKDVIHRLLSAPGL